MPDAPLFPNAYATVQRQGRAGNLSNQFHKILVAAGFANKRSHHSTGKGRDASREQNEISFHSLRHTATTLLKAAGVSDAITREFIGHESPPCPSNTLIFPPIPCGRPRTSCQTFLNEWQAVRRNQRAFLLHFTGDARLSPHDHAGSVPQKARSCRAASQWHRMIGVFACGSATVVTLRLRSCVCAPALHFPVRQTAGRSKGRRLNDVADFSFATKWINRITNDFGDAV